MDPNKVIMGKVKGDRSLQVFKVLAESVGKASEPAHLHPDREVLPFDVGCRNLLHFRIPHNDRAIRTYDMRGRIPTRSNRIGFIAFYYCP
jgi:hypothetical protein